MILLLAFVCLAPSFYVSAMTKALTELADTALRAAYAEEYDSAKRITDALVGKTQENETKLQLVFDHASVNELMTMAKTADALAGLADKNALIAALIALRGNLLTLESVESLSWGVFF